MASKKPYKFDESTMSLEAGDGFIPRSDPRIDRPRPRVEGTENLSWKQISEKYPCRNGQVPMHIAAMTGRMNMFEKLCPSNAGRNPSDDNGRTPLHLAAEQGHLEICRYITSNEGSIPRNLDLVMLEFKHNKHKPIYLFPQTNVNPKDDKEWTPLHLAAQNGHLNICKFIMESLDPEAINPPGCRTQSTPLHLAAVNGHLPVCKLIIKKLTDKSPDSLNPKDVFDITPLHLVADHDHYEICKLILLSIRNLPEGYGFTSPVTKETQLTPWKIGFSRGNKALCNLLTVVQKSARKQMEIHFPTLTLEKLCEHSLLEDMPLNGVIGDTSSFGFLSDCPHLKYPKRCLKYLYPCTVPDPKDYDAIDDCECSDCELPTVE